MNIDIKELERFAVAMHAHHLGCTDDPPSSEELSEELQQFLNKAVEERISSGEFDQSEWDGY